MNENDLPAREMSVVECAARSRMKGSTHTVGEISDQVLDGQSPGLQLVVQPSLDQLVSRGGGQGGRTIW